MTTQQVLKMVTGTFISVSALCLLSVSLMAFRNPQAVMDLVSVKLTNTDAVSSIRGVYGGAGMAMVFLLVYLVRWNHRMALFFLSSLWGLYAVSRLITWYVDGMLGDFGIRWMVIETLLCVLALVLWMLNQRLANGKS